MAKKFSIITAIYNHTKHFDTYFKALDLQTFKDFDVHICDDGSDDNPAEALLKYRTEYPIYYHRQKHKGFRLARNVNQGIAEARGEYCVFIMGDSFPEQNYLEIASKKVNPESVLCGIRINVEGKKVIGFDWRLRKGKIPKQEVLLVKEPYSKMTGNGLIIPTNVLREVGMWNKKYEGYGGEDNELLVRLYYSGYLCWSVPELILYHWYHRKTLVEDEKKIIELGKLVASYGR